jgi:hypothetical protein
MKDQFELGGLAARRKTISNTNKTQKALTACTVTLALAMFGGVSQAQVIEKEKSVNQASSPSTLMTEKNGTEAQLLRSPRLPMNDATRVKPPYRLDDETIHPRSMKPDALSSYPNFLSLEYLKNPLLREATPPSKQKNEYLSSAGE